jgi:hypothetical protein
MIFQQEFIKQQRLGRMGFDSRSKPSPTVSKKYSLLLFIADSNKIQTPKSARILK